MKLQQVKDILSAEVLTCEENLEREVSVGFGCDLMSDVLAFAKEESILLTGLINPQVIRTAEMIDIFVIIFVRGKKPSEHILEMAKERDITIMSTDYILYTACGKLYENGLKGLKVRGEERI